MGTQKSNKFVSSEENIDVNIFHSLFENSLSGILYGNPDDGSILDVNPAAAEIFGYTINELKALNRNDVFDFEHHTMINSLNTREKTGSARGELIGIRKNGEHFPCEFTSSLFVNERGENRTCTIVNDITERKKSQKLIVSNEKRFRSIIEHTGDLISMADENGIIIYVSPAVERLVGLSKDEIINKSYQFTIHPDYLEESKSVFKELLANPGVPIHRVTKILHQDGHYISVEGFVTNLLNDENVGAIVSNYRDISEKVELKSLKEFEQRNKEALINTTDDLLWSVSTDFKLIEGNKAFIKATKQATGIDLKSGDSLLLNEKLGTDYIDYWEKLYKRAFLGEAFKIEVYSPEQEGINKMCLETSFNPIYDKDIVTGVACYSRDITESKNAFELLKENEQEREQIISELSQNNKDLKQFSYVTSHNLRAPIANLLGLTSLIDHYKVPNKSLKQILDGIKQSALIFDDTVKDLTKVLVIKDQTNIIKEEVSFVTVINNVLRQLSISIDDNATVVNYDFENAPYVKFTNAYLESILLNLFTNSIKYKSYKRELKINVFSKNYDNYIELRFEDNGVGIDTEKHKDKLFKLYQRFHDNTDGKGLGLYLIKSQLETLGGTISIESKVDVGTTFIIKFKK